jgi:transitional endoplasmic reticulum ATPase
MTDRRTATVVVDPDAPADAAGLADGALPDGTDALLLRSTGGRRTVVAPRVDAAADAGTVRLPPAVVEALGVADGDSVVVEPTAVAPARELVVAPVAQLSVRGGEDAVRAELSGRPVVAGDVVSVSLLGGTLDLPVRVTETTPDGPVALDDSTALSVETGPAPAVADLGAGPVPPAAVGGYDATVDACRSAIAAPLRSPDAYRVGGESVAAGVLVAGQRGVGKTHHVRHAAWLADATIRTVDCARLAADGPDSVDDRLDEAARAAATGRSVVVHLDDLDALAGEEGLTPTGRRLGAWIDRVAGLDDAVVVGETRDAEGLDAALTRGGRLARTVTVPAPDDADREAVLSVLFRGVDLAADVDPALLAARTPGYVAADLDAFRARCIEAALARTDAGARPQVTRADVETAAGETTPTAATPVGAIPSTTFDDIGGLAEVKRELTRAVEWPLRYADELARLGVEAPAGVLLYGPPGTGKTMLARAVASTTDANFLMVNGPELLNKYVGESERRVRALFERARESAPAVVFFDEVDALGTARTADGEASAPDRVVSQLLTELDGLEPRERVTVIGATNRPDRIDEALTRPGRFDRRVEVPLPDAAARREILRVHLRGRPVESLDVAELAARTEGYSGSDINALLQEASLLAFEERLDADGAPPGTAADGPVVRRRHVDRALDRVGPSLSRAARERYESAASSVTGGDDGPDGGSDPDDSDD